jgi:putative RecB family exonuclease
MVAIEMCPSFRYAFGERVKTSSLFRRCTETYSHSRLSCFEQCPRRYKLQYIDNVEVEERRGIEAFLGTRVHESLQLLYEEAKRDKILDCADLLKHLRCRWYDELDGSVIVVRKGMRPEDYREMAERFVIDYYKKHHPFDRGETVGLEHEVRFNLGGPRTYEITGHIDRLTRLGDGVYEIHDYKTGRHLPKPSDLRKDRQLALYEVGIRSSYPDVKDVHLVWHFLAHNREMRSKRTLGDLERLKSETMVLIDQIEGAVDFPAHPSFLCNWCGFQTICGIADRSGDATGRHDRFQ